MQPDISNKPVKYLVYSAHDTTVSAALIAMDVWDDVQPYYASGNYSLLLFVISYNLYVLALLFERYTDGMVEISFVNGTMEEDILVHNLTEKTCGEYPCSIQSLADAWRTVIPEVRNFFRKF